MQMLCGTARTARTCARRAHRQLDGGQPFGFRQPWLLWTNGNAFHIANPAGLDLPDFLQGSRLAYAAVTRLMYSRDWDALEPLVSPAMLNAMQQTMEEEPFDVRRVEGCEEEEASSSHRRLCNVFSF